MNRRPRAPQSIGINFDSKCNARCGHCCVESSPQSTEHLDDDQVDEIIRQSLGLPKVKEIGFTGGEPLLRKQRLLELMRRIVAAGRSTTLVTNGFWAVTPEIARRTVDELYAAGLRTLTLSYDDFHAPYIKPARIRNALDAIVPTDMKVILNMAVSSKKDSFDLLRELGDSTLGVQVTRFPVLPAGQAVHLPDSSFQRHPLRFKDLRCPGYELIFHHDGYVYPCCSPVVFDTQLTLGRVGDFPVDGFISRVERNILLAIIQREGFDWFLRKLREKDAGIPGLDFDDVVSACEVCLRLFKDSAVVDVLRKEIFDYGDALQERVNA